MADGFIKICRKMLKWEWYKNVNTRILFIHCLLMANWEPGSWRGIDYKAGEFVTSLPNLATGCGLSIQQTRTALSNLQSTGEITVKTLSTGRIITVNNWNKYQTVTDYLTGNQQDINRQPNRQSTGNLTSDKEIKNIRKEEEKNNKKKIIKEKPIRHQYGLYKNVLLSDEDMEKLKREFPKDYQDRIERVSEYCKSKGKSYSDYLATIRSWARKENNGRGITEGVSRSEAESEREIEEHVSRLLSGEPDPDDDGLWD